MNETCVVCQEPSEDWICGRCRESAVVIQEPAPEEPMPPAVEATNPSEIERGLWARKLSAWDRFWVEILVRAGVAGGVRDALIEHRAVEEQRRRR